MGFKTITSRVLEAIFKLAGTCKDLDEPCFRSMLPRSFVWHNWAWWQDTKKDFEKDSRNVLKWKHRPEYKKLAMWEDVLVDFLGPEWYRLGGPAWKRQLSAFMDSAYKMVQRAWPEKSQKKIDPGRLSKTPREVVLPTILWPDNHDNFVLVDIFGDSLDTINWVNGIWTCNSKRMQDNIHFIQNTLSKLHIEKYCMCRKRTVDYARHVFRELNVAADERATRCLERRAIRRSCLAPARWPKYIEISFDGGFRRTVGAAAWIMRGAQVRDEKSGNPRWQLLAESSVRLVDCEDATVAETTALAQGICALDRFLRNRQIDLGPEGWVL